MQMKLSTMMDGLRETLILSKLKILMVVVLEERLLISVLININKASNTF